MSEDNIVVAIVLVFIKWLLLLLCFLFPLCFSPWCQVFSSFPRCWYRLGIFRVLWQLLFLNSLYCNKGVKKKFVFQLACLPHRGCSLLEVEGSLSQRQKLTAEVSALAEEEQKLEQLIQRCSLDMRHMSESASNQKYPFVFSWHFFQKDKKWLPVSSRLVVKPPLSTQVM